MTTLKEGANFNVQKTYYLACTRSLIDYGAPVLTDLTDKQKAHIEVIQNNAMRLMLGAPMWTRLCNLRMEANLPSLEDRISVRNTCQVAKTLLSGRESHTKTKIKNEMQKHPEVRTPASYVKDLSNTIKDLGVEEQLKSLRPDEPNNELHIPPWNNELTKFSYTLLPRSKANCSPQELQAAARTAIELTETPGCNVYYTDGTVDPDTNTTGAAVYSENFSACWRTSNSASTMQTELIAIKQALRNSLDNEQGSITIHTDSRSAMQALSQAKHKENKELLTSIKLLLHLLKEEGRTVTFNWIPSHIDIPGNEKADELAKSTKHIDRVQIHIQPSLQQIKNKIKTTIHGRLAEDINSWINKNSPTALWYKIATQFIPAPIQKITPRATAVTMHRLRLGYKACWEIVENTIKDCEHCHTETDTPLLHYLLQCPETNTIRGNIQTPDDLTTRESLLLGANLVKDIIENYETFDQAIKRLPPPR